MNKNSRLNLGCREKSPCADCTERFLACSDRCPKDKRGEYGYKAWKAYIEEIKRKRKEYINMQRRYKF